MTASQEGIAPQPQATAYLTADEITRLLENIEIAATQRGQYTLAEFSARVKLRKALGSLEVVR